MTSGLACADCRYEIEYLDDGVYRIRITGPGRPLSFHDVLKGWSAGAALTDFFTRMIAVTPFAALYWEMPPLSRLRLEREYECVLIDSPELAGRAANPAPFNEYFGGDEDVVEFASLGADALLIAPTPGPEDGQYPHLAAYCRNAPAEQSRHFWQRIGAAALIRIGETPTWISTAGLGVSWLHARLDSRPKYYSHAPYRRWPEPAGDADA